jgi:hypothetical protein
MYEDHGRSVLGSVLAHVYVVAVDRDEVPDPSSFGAWRVRHGGYDDARQGQALLTAATEISVERG